MTRLAELAALLSATLDGNPELEISSVAPIQTAGPHEVAFLAHGKRAPEPERLTAGCVIVGTDVTRHELGARVALLRVRDPYLGFALAMQHFHPEAAPSFSGIAPGATLHPTVEVGACPSIASGVWIGAGTRIGDNVILHAGVSVGDDVVLGDDVQVFPNVTIYSHSRIGHRVRIHAGAVLGSDGFGYAASSHGAIKIPHRGRVVIEDDVEVGANTTIDRGALDDTVIRRGAKIDNLVQIGHNCVVGAHSFIAGQAGLAGSCTIGQGVQIGGQAGLSGHLHVGDRARIAGQSGVHSSVPAGASMLGSPATDLRVARRTYAVLYQLPELRLEVERLRQAVARLEGSAARSE
ncbi:MAG: UDP-3-O-(3-hydroxymyristoyl)glucosamine N-acyltransferase [Planctomycetota bacterium]